MKADETIRLVRKHAQSNTYIIKDEAFSEKSVHVRGSLITGTHVGFWGDLIVEGSLSLGNRGPSAGTLRQKALLLETMLR